MRKIAVSLDQPNSKSQIALQDHVRQWSDQYSEGMEGFCRPEDAEWIEYQKFPLANFELGPHENWIDSFNQECKFWATEGEPNRYDDMADGLIKNPVVFLYRNGVYYLWDGVHRIGAALKAGVEVVPAIIGTPKITLRNGA